MPRGKKTLYLIDGANYVFRAFYALPALSNSKGFPTGALYGFTQMLLALLRDAKPDHIAVVFDRPEPTFRDEMYADYKATRKEPPDDLVQQFPHFIPLVEALGIKVLEMAGFEADDIIGTLAKRFASKDLDVVLVSGDKDLMQLIGDNVSMLDTMKEKHFDEKDVEERFGVGPEHLVDVLGLAGDSSDNVPGLPGVGPKTASKLIAKYGSIENLIEHADELKPGIRDKLKEYLDQVKLSKELVTIKTDMDIDADLDDLIVGEPQQDDLHKMFQEFEFTKLLSELAPQKSIQGEEYRLIDDMGMLNDVVESIRAAGRVAVDLAVSSPDAMKCDLIGIALAWSPGQAAYIPVGHSLGLGEKQLGEKDVLSKLAPVFEDDAVEMIAHDVKFIDEVLNKRDIVIKGVNCDTMLVAYLIDQSTQSTLPNVSARYLDHQIAREDDVMGKGAKRKTFDRVDLATATQVKGEVADVILQLSDVLMPKLKGEGLDKLYHEMELPLIDVLREMEMTGIKIDSSRLARMSKEFSEKLKGLESEIFKEAGEEFNVMSPKQLGFILFEKLKLPGAKKTKTGYSTSQDVLDDLAIKHRLPELILSYRQLAKLKSTYIDALPQLIDPKTGRIHTTFNQTVTATGRLSSSDPNLQNIPIRRPEGRLIREAFVADKGCIFLDADYSQIELRVLAHLSKDPALVDAFNNNIDVHSVTASGIFGVKPEKVTDEQRAVGKTVNFATIYGQSAYGLSQQLKIEVGEAASYIDGYFEKYPNVEKYRDEVLKGARKSGYVETLYGRRRYLPDINSSNGALRSLAERMAFNAVFQGTAADVIKRAMITIHRDLASISEGARMLLQVHDELLFEVPEADADGVKGLVKEHMESAVKLSVPLLVDVGLGPTWATAH